MPFLEIRDLTRIYGTGDTAVQALNHVSLSVERGEFVSIMGASGSGKSTLLHLLGGVDQPTSGEVILDGVSLYQQKEEALTIFRRRQIGLVYQFYNLVPLLTVEENLTLPLLLDGQSVDSTTMLDLLNRLGLEGKGRAFPSQLSGGQQQRVAIARALITRPALLLADEPTGNLDSAAGAQVMQLLLHLNQTIGQTIIMITHDENLALQSKRMIRLQDGNVVGDEVIQP